ncbi:PQQ-dependent catabolism-associated CXXCW motif protein [Stutzerimonas stutzeri]|uniref:PQQ-dependent catabolism-associated CXXCW motif protein n=1 Tax=Stutzerimonas stutzeri TaxID=316 RepID=UPI000651B90C|nr:PQQ-dependent catabolism-associated CXXCW motif protein [Stutzerimonas stutzeri]AKN27008.1 rhodanese-related sulfurtransferase [Stutzerimonas stutzeri]KXO82367.1 sulfurtransferase [Stutzerimonas stutzeri]MPS58752.1 PQQ-dependent catabolism-associated CXXCW motif protein [Pseudomonas sp.]RRV30663.1 PQQ-dependent catabolism-associated CXXCW motif protein [Stutzerimonas stutzeri]
MFRSLLPLLIAALPGFGMSVTAVAEEQLALFSAEGYRQTQYRSPTPATAEGAQTLDTAALQALLAKEPDVVLVDVYRSQWLAGRFVDSEPHANLPGSIWLANTGDGNLQPEWASYFSDNLKRLSQGDAERPLVFYCRSDCWLGWNATRRAHALGYKRLYWYRDGVDGWEQAGLPLHPATPEPPPGDD